MKNQVHSFGAAVVILGQITSAIAGLWSYVLCFQVNGGGLSGFISFFLTLLLPGVAQLAWCWWAFVHGNPYLWIVLASVILWGGGFLIMTASERR